MKFQEQSFSILLVDDNDQQRACCAGILEAEGYQCHFVNGKDEARDFIRRQVIDLVLIDIEMIDADDIHELKYIKEGLGENFVPIILITEEFNDQEINSCMESGFDDFIVKPLNQTILKAKVRAFLHIKTSYQKQLKNQRELVDYHQLVDQEQEVAANLYEKILRADYLETSVVKAVISPKSLFNGDFLLVSRSPDDNLHVLLGDFNSHGISASIVANPIAEIFYGMTAKGFDIDEIASEINRKLYKLLPVNMFLAATIVALNPASKSLKLITCGLPEHFLVNHNTGNLTTISSANLPLGIQSSIECECQNYVVGSDDYLYLLTDAVFEAENVAGKVFAVESVIDCIKQNGNGGFEKLQSGLNQHCKGVEQADNMTYLELACDVDNAPWRNPVEQQQHKHTDALTWKSIMEFDIDALRKLNPVPVMVNALMEIQSLQDHQQTIFMIVTELFANALDHGVLELDSSIKQTPEGFMRFYELKAERLLSYEEGSIRIFMAHQPIVSGGRLTIKVIDSGEGFDYSTNTNDLDTNIKFSGRGMALLDSLCSHLTYHGKGNRVTAVFEWDS